MGLRHNPNPKKKERLQHRRITYLFLINWSATDGALKFEPTSTIVLSDVDEMAPKSVFVDEVFDLQR